MTMKNISLKAVKSSKAAFAHRDFVGPCTPSLRLAWAICYAIGVPSWGDEMSGNFATNVELVEAWCRKNRHRYTSASMPQREQISRLSKVFRDTEIFKTHKMDKTRIIAQRIKREIDAEKVEV